MLRVRMDWLQLTGWLVLLAIMLVSVLLLAAAAGFR